MKSMKKTLAALLALVLLLSAAAVAETYVKFTENARCFKSAGGKQTDVIIGKGSVSVAEDDIGRRWTKVYIDEDHELWVKSSHLKETDDDEMRIVYASGGTGRSTVDEDEEAESYKRSKKYVYAKANCNVRKSPALDGKKLQTLKKGATLKYLGKRIADDRGVYWYKVKAKNGKTGWVSEAFTKLK